MSREFEGVHTRLQKLLELIVQNFACRAEMFPAHHSINFHLSNPHEIDCFVLLNCVLSILYYYCSNYNISMIFFFPTYLLLELMGSTYYTHCSIAL